MSDPTFFTHNEIVDVISDIQMPQHFLLNSFSREYLSSDQQINFDKISDDKRIAVFVNPRRPGVVLSQRGSSVVSYKPGYIKDKRTIDPTHVFYRKAGQPMNSGLTPHERYAATVVDLSQIQITALLRRLEWMASQLLLKGKYTMSGDDMNVDIDFDRDSDKTKTLSGNAQWIAANKATADPIEDLVTWVELCEAPIRRIILGSGAYKFLRKSPAYQREIVMESRLGDRNFTNMPQKDGWANVTYRGMLGSIELYTYSDTYKDPDTGNLTLFIPTNAVIGVPDAGYGIQCYAPIQDADANYETLPYYMKNWIEKDPGIPYLMLQSAPMLAHIKINGTFAVNTGAS